MINISRQSRLVILFAILFVYQPTYANTIHVAVASNFTHAMRVIAARFEARTQHKIILAFGSTGKHYAQIRNGAPFDLFFAADVRRPQLLEEEHIAIAGSRFTYAVGNLVLWSPNPDLVDSQGMILGQNRFYHLAVANPRLAPYGAAAQQVLETKKLWSKLKGKLVRGENIGQAYQFVASGNAELGFVALSQIQRPGHPVSGSYWIVPQSFYQIIEQQAVVLRDDSVTRSFITYIKGREARAIINQFGYATP